MSLLVPSTSSLSFRTSSKSGLEADYHLITGTIPSLQIENHVIVVAIASAKLPVTITVKPGT